MVCKQCGNEIAPDAKFCGVCGAVNDGAVTENINQQYAEPQSNPVGPANQGPYAQPYAQPAPMPQQPQYAQPQYAQPQYAQPQYAAPVEDPQERAMSKSTLVFGILGIAFGCSFYLAVLGIVFGAIAMAKAKGYVAAGYPLTGRAKTGKILGIVGFILGIVFTVIVTIIIIAAIAGSASSSYYYYY